MSQFIKADEGHKWALTEEGKLVSRIAAKYAFDYLGKSRYEKSVPASWVRNNWVQQIVIEE